jgi:hypothetical protein
MRTTTHDLVIRLDRSGEKFVFFIARQNKKEPNEAAQTFSVEITLEELRNRGGAGAERLIGESVLGFFDHLTDGELELPKHYRDA